MSDERPGVELFALVERRAALLERLDGEPADKRTLTGELAVSRSTLDRALRELELVGWVEYDGGRYELTAAGRLTLATYHEWQATTADLVAIRDLLEPLDPDLDLPAVAFRRAEVELAEGPTPYGPLDRVRELLASADRMRILARAMTDPRLLDAAHDAVVTRGATIELVGEAELLADLADRHPDKMRGLAAADGGTVRAVERLPYGLALVDDGETSRLVLALYDRGQFHGTAVTDAPEAVRWGESRVETAAEDAVDITAELAAGDREGRHRAAIRAQGLVELTTVYFAEREPRSPEACLRAGVGLPEVRAGHALDREYERDGERRSMAADLVDRLRDGTPHVVLGPPGSGKSTVCRQVACRWHEAGHGPVFYRTGGSDRPLSASGVLGRRLREADGHALLVVEDATRPDASAVFDLLRAVRSTPSVSVLLDAPTEAWYDPPVRRSGAVESYRQEAVEPVRMPSFDERTCRRLVDHVERTTGRAVTLAPGDLFAAVSGDDHDEGVSPLLLAVHRLARHVDPLAADEPTGLVEAVRRAHEELAGVELEAAALVNLWNVAGLEVRPELLRALVDPGEVDSVLAALDGRVTFGTEDGRLRTVHGTWSALFLEELDAEGALLPCIESVLALADDPERLADASTLGERLRTDPGSWVAETTERLFAVGRDRPGLAALFGQPGALTLPGCSPPDLGFRCSTWRGEMSLDAGAFDLATDAFERVLESVPDAGLDEEPTAELVARAHRGLGKVARRRGDLDGAERHHEAALDRYRSVGDTAGVASCLNNLGTVAWARGDLDAAESRFAETLERKREAGDRRGVANARNNLGIVASARGELSTATDHHEAALEIRRTVGDRRGEGDSLTNLGVVARDRGDLDDAEQYARAALDLWQDLGDRHGEANGLYQLGEVEHERGDLDAAETYLTRSLDIREEIGDEQGRADTVRLLGAVARDRGDLETAVDRAEEALAAFRRVEDSRGEGQALALRGSVARERGDLAAAAEDLERAVDLFTAAGSTLDALDALDRLVEATVAAGEESAARTACERAVDLAAEAGLEEERERFESRAASLAA